jgi:ketosteroid isomerase-like protein
MSFAKPSSSPQFIAVRKFYEAITHWDFDALEALFSEDYVHKTLPASANDPPKNKAQGIAHARAVGAMLDHAPLKVSSRARARRI